MVKYKCIDGSNCSSAYKTGDIYSINYVPRNGYLSLVEMLRKSPDLFMKIEDDMKKTLTIDLKQAKELYTGNGSKMDKLLLANFNKEELVEPELPDSWLNIGKIAGYYVSDHSEIYKNTEKTTSESHQNLFATEKQAKSALAMAQLSQLMKVYNGDWNPNWRGQENKYIIMPHSNTIHKGDRNFQQYFLAFKSKELRDKFFDNFQDLIKQYFMID